MNTESSTTLDRNVNQAKLERILVIISPDMVKPGAPMESTLINRALALAKASGSEVEFFHACYDDTLTRAMSIDLVELHSERQELLTREATLMAELVLRLDGQGVTIRQDTRWDTPRTEAILRKITESQPDLVMKQSKDHGYVMGLVSNTDWDLVRRSPAHLWFVTEGGSNQIERLVTAVGSDADDQDMISAVDFDVFRVANLIASQFDATNYPVHAYQVPRGPNYAAYAPEFSGFAYPVATIVPSEQVGREIAQKHGRSIEAFAEFFHTAPDQVKVVEGDPRDVLPELAKSLKADLVVMAARNLSRWDRLFESGTAEPVLADTPCDILFVKDARDALAPELAQDVAQGVPAYDLEAAVLNPQKTFGSPAALERATQISVAMRKRILQVWEQDISAQMVEEDEGGPVRSTNADLLRAIVNTRSNLNSDSGQRSAKPAELMQ